LVTGERGGNTSPAKSSRMKIDILVVGAGFAGSVIAERFASDGKSVLVIDKRPHIAGNAFDELDSSGVLVHRYGPHIFHTNAIQVEEYLSRFTAWRKYEHRVLSSVDGKLYPVPINLQTINQLYNLSLDEAGAAKFLENVREKREPVRNSEDIVLNNVGRDLCDKFFRNYTRKQWGLDLSELSPAVAGRIPVRTNSDDRYFTDKFQSMPAEGYTKMFERMLGHPNIRVELSTEFESVRHNVKAEKTFYSGPIDAYFDFCYGRLPYRSLSFRHQHLPCEERYQPVGTVNYPNEHEYTRITEFKHLTGQIHTGTSIVREFPQIDGDPYYPVPTAENQVLYQSYRKLADAEPATFFIGRLAEYRYYNMDQVVAAALLLSGKHLKGT
jgi:UDP-galactopyranose mutase